MFRKRVTGYGGFISLVLATLIQPAWAQVAREVPPSRQFTWQELLSQDEAARARGEAGVPREAPDHGRVQTRQVPSPSLRQDAEAVGGQSLLFAPEALCAGFPAPPAHNFGFGFQGLGDDNTARPPDTIGAVGPRHVMTMLNTQVRIHNRDGSLNYSTVALSTFWAGLTGPFDPKVFYDNLSGRWIAVCLGNSRSANSDWEIAISATNDPTGAWTSYHQDGDAANTRWVDFPCVGFNEKWVAVTFNAFAVPGVTPTPVTGSKMWVFNKPELLVGGTVGFVEFDVDFDIDSGFCMQPAICMEPGVADLHILDSSGWTGDPNGNTNWLRLSRISGTAAAPAWSALPGSSTIKAGFFPVQNRFSNTMLSAAQRDDATGLDAGDTRMCNVVYRNGRIWAVHSGGYPADTPDRNALFWYELQPSLPNPIIQSGIIQSGGSNAHYIYPSIAVNCGNDACIGFSSTSPAIYASACYVTRLAGDPPGVTSSTQYFRDGRAKYVKLDSSSRNRWGDYSATVVDPLDDKTFWTLQEYAELPSGGVDRWAVQWAQITRDCPVPGITQHPQSQTICLGQPVTFSIGVDAVSVAEYQWRKNGQPIVGAKFYSYTIAAVTAADTAQYSCTVIGLCAATTSNPATLEVVTVPTIEIQPFGPGDVCPGTNQSIVGPLVTGYGPIVKQLEKLVAGVWQNVPGQVDPPGNIYTFLPIQASDTGDYRIACTNPCGTVYTNTFHIQVGVSFNQQPAPLTKNPCESANFSVTAVGIGGLSYQWRHEGVNLADDAKVSGANSSTLFISDLRYEDEGAYRCVVTDDCGPVTSNPASLTLTTPIWQSRYDITRPYQRRWTAFAYDENRGVCVLYGGYGPSSPDGPGGYYGDHWEYDGVEWIKRTPPQTPLRRYGHAMVYDSDRKRIYLFGGNLTDPPFGFSSDLWEFDGTTWTLRKPMTDPDSPPGAVSVNDLPIAYDSIRKKVVLVTAGAQGQTNDSKTWEYDPAANTWSERVASNGFPGGYHDTMAFDPGIGQCVRYYTFFLPDRQTWRWNGISWVKDPVTDPHLFDSEMAYDTTRRRCVLFQHYEGANIYPTESWYYSNLDWTLLHPSGPPSSPPTDHFLVRMAYDSKRRAMVALMVDYDTNPLAVPFDQWEYRYLDRVVFDRHPQSQALTPDGNATFKVYAAGYGTLAYQWKRNGQNLADGPAPGGGTFSGATTPVLTLTGVQPADGGIYTCAVSNSCGGAISNGALLGTPVPSDFDGDGDVDGDDLDLFEACASGPGVPLATGCETKDFDSDGDADQSDFALLQLCLSGDGIPADPSCMN